MNDTFSNADSGRWLRLCADLGTEEEAREVHATTPPRPPVNLRFLPHMTLIAAARVADDHGCELRVSWNPFRVECVRKLDPDWIPPLLRLQAE